MKQLRIRDNAVVPKASFSEIPGITQKVANKTLKQLEREGVFVFPERDGRIGRPCSRANDFARRE